MTPEEFAAVETWGAGTRGNHLDRTPAQLATIRNQAMPLWTVLFDVYVSVQLGYTTAVGDLATLSGLDHNYIHSLVAWVMSAEHPDIVDLYVDDQPEA